MRAQRLADDIKERRDLAEGSRLLLRPEAVRAERAPYLYVPAKRYARGGQVR